MLLVFRRFWNTQSKLLPSEEGSCHPIKWASGFSSGVLIRVSASLLYSSVILVRCLSNIVFRALGDRCASFPHFLSITLSSILNHLPSQGHTCFPSLCPLNPLFPLFELPLAHTQVSHTPCVRVQLFKGSPPCVSGAFCMCSCHSPSSLLSVLISQLSPQLNLKLL